MPKLLVVVDDTQSRDALDVALQLHWPHVTVVAASSGEEALRVVRDQERDVVILNTSLPDLSGFEVLRQIRLISEAPVILLSDGHNETDQVRGLQLGADDVVVKPFSALVLIVG